MVTPSFVLLPQQLLVLPGSGVAVIMFAPLFVRRWSKVVAEAVAQQNGMHSGIIQANSLSGRWQMRGRIGSYHHGEIYEANDSVQSRRVEIETLRPELFTDLDFWSLNETLDSMVAPLSGLQHRSIDTVLSFGIHETSPYLVYENNSLFTLRSLLCEQSKLPIGTVRELAEHILLSLTTAHRNDVWHLGLSPDRVLLTLDSANTRLAVVRGYGVVSALRQRFSNMMLLTKMGTTLAPAQYMAPELFAGQQVDERADLYSLGAILYELFTGTPPFTSDSLIDLLLQVRSEPVKPIASIRPELSDDPFLAFVERLLAKQPTERPTSASVCLTALRALPEVRRTRPPEMPQLDRSGEYRAPTLPPLLQSQTAPSPERVSSTRSSWIRSWIAPVLLAAVVLNGILGLLLVRSSFREREVSQLARIEDGRQAARTAEEESTRARLATGDLPQVEAEGDQKAAELPVIDRTVTKKTSEVAIEKSDTTKKPSSAEVKRTAEQQKPVAISALGVTVRVVDSQYIQQNGLLNAEGLLVEHIDEAGPAYKAGLREKDILQFTETAGKSILSWTPEPLKTSSELQTALLRAKATDTRLALVIKRGSYDGLVVFIRDFAH